MKKQLPTDVISSELAESSVFFQKAPVQNTPPKPQPGAEPGYPPTAPARDEQSHTSNQPSNDGVKQASNTDVMIDVMIDVMTSQFQAINLRKWQETIENTETQNTALRMTAEERYAIEDAVNELRRKYGIKTSMNEIARLGLLLLIADFKKNKKESLIHKVKKA